MILLPYGIFFGSTAHWPLRKKRPLEAARSWPSSCQYVVTATIVDCSMPDKTEREKRRNPRIKTNRFIVYDHCGCRDVTTGIRSIPAVGIPLLKDNRKCLSLWMQLARAGQNGILEIIKFSAERHLRCPFSAF